MSHSKRFALEVRNTKWFEMLFLDWAKRLGLTWVRVDSLDFPNYIFNANQMIYVRMGGRTA